MTSFCLSDSANHQVGFFNLVKNQTIEFIKRFVIQTKSLENGAINAEFLASSTADEHFTRQFNWLKSIFAPKIAKWNISMQSNDNAKPKSAFDAVESLTMINLSEYNQLYNELKVKYGERMVKVFLFLRIHLLVLPVHIKL